MIGRTIIHQDVRFKYVSLVNHCQLSELKIPNAEEEKNKPDEENVWAYETNN